jgi:hypothetical protein
MLLRRESASVAARLVIAALASCVFVVANVSSQTSARRQQTRPRTTSAPTRTTPNAPATPPAPTTAPSDAQQTPTPSDGNQTPPVSDISTDDVDLSITAHVTARELRFEEAPNVSVEFTGQPRGETVWEAERQNLPRPVRPGETYRDIGIRLRIVSVFADIDRIVAEALGEVPVNDNNENAPTTSPTPTQLPQPQTPTPTSATPTSPPDDTLSQRVSHKDSDAPRAAVKAPAPRTKGRETTP